MTTPPDTWTTYEQALQSLSDGTSKLDAPTLVMKLRRSFPDANVHELNLAVETYIARHQAPEKLGAWAREGHFSFSLLQQASRQSIAHYRAQFFAGRKHVLEIGTGTGSDTAALARVAEHVTTIESDPVAADLAKRNLALQGVTNVTFIVGDAQEVNKTLPKKFDALFADPMRRSRTGERIKRGDDYSPPLSFLLGLEVGTLRAIKISPGLFVEPCPERWTRQFVGFGEECLEQTLWFGSPIADSSIAVTDRKALWTPPKKEPLARLTDTLEGYLVEAHATLNRCQKLEVFFAEHDIQLFEQGVAYGISTKQPERSDLFTSFRIIGNLPYSKKNLKRVLEGLQWSSRTEFKKRSFPGDIEQIRAELNLPKHTHTSPFGVVFFFRYHGRPWALAAERLYEK